MTNTRVTNQELLFQKVKEIYTPVLKGESSYLDDEVRDKMRALLLLAKEKGFEYEALRLENMQKELEKVQQTKDLLANFSEYKKYQREDKYDWECNQAILEGIYKRYPFVLDKLARRLLHDLLIMQESHDIAWLGGERGGMNLDNDDELVLFNLGISYSYIFMYLKDDREPKNLNITLEEILEKIISGKAIVDNQIAWHQHVDERIKREGKKSFMENLRDFDKKFEFKRKIRKSVLIAAFVIGVILIKFYLYFSDYLN